MAITQLIYRGTSNRPAKRLSGATFIYVKTEITKGDSLIEEIKRPKVRVSEADIFSDKFYSNYREGLKIALGLEVKQFYTKDYQGGKLEFIEYKGQRYRILRFNTMQRDRVFMDLEEVV